MEISVEHLNEHLKDTADSRQKGNLSPLKKEADFPKAISALQYSHSHIYATQPGVHTIPIPEDQRAPLPPSPLSIPGPDSTSDQAGESKEPWLPYENAWTETPFLYCVHKLVRKWVQFRQTMLRNAYFSKRLPFPCVGSVNRSLTVGEIGLLLIFIASLAVCVAYAVKDSWSVGVSGKAAAVPTALTVVLCTRNSIFTLLLGIPFERQLYWHKFMAYAAVTIAWVHGYLAFHKDKSMSDGNLSGTIFGAALVLMILSSIAPIRRYFFNFFYIFHVLLFVVAGAAGLWHNAGGIKFGLPIWLADVLLRYVYLSVIRNPNKCTAVELPANIIRLTFPKKDFKYCAGQYVFIMIPKINVFEWHPFSISSAPHHDTVSLHIKALGNWTRRLFELMPKESEDQNGGIRVRRKEIELKVFIDGPYGSPEVDVDSTKYKLFLLISGGIGITPMQSVCNQLVHEHEDRGRPMKKVVFIWSVADKFMVASAFEKDRQWVKGARKDNYTSRLPIASDPRSMRRLSVDPAILNRQSTFKQCLRQGSTMRYPTKPEVDILHTEFYLTRLKKDHDLHASHVQRDLHPYVRYGRPNYSEIFLTFRNFAIQHREHDVAVMVCGPQPMVNDVRSLCSSFSQDGVRFDFHGEVFEF